METPIRRLKGITYWVIETPHRIHDFINCEIRKELETDAFFEGRDPPRRMVTNAVTAEVGIENHDVREYST